MSTDTRDQLPPPQIQDRGRRCPTCAAFPRLLMPILDPSKGRTVRLYECACGERIWDDTPQLPDYVEVLKCACRPDLARSLTMDRNLLFMCLRSGVTVQGRPDAVCENEGRDDYQQVDCAACGSSHFINKKTGKVLDQR